MAIPSSSGPQSLVGRERELGVLREQLAGALTGHGGLVLIGGEAGIGKTALAEALYREAEQQGALVLVGRCYDLTETPPYGPWVEAVARYRPADGMPPLPDAFAEQGTVGQAASQAALFHQVLDFFTALAASRPVLVVLDDLHWSDPASLDLLRVMARSVGTLPVLLVVTYRADELTRRHPLYALLPLLARESDATRLDLHRLTVDALRALVRVRYRLDTDDEARLVAYIQAHAEGNTLFTVEMLRTLEEQGGIRATGDGWCVDNLGAVVVPPLVQQLIDSRAARLGKEAHRLLATAAVIGHVVPPLVWAAVTEADEDALLDLAERAAAAGIVEAAGVGDMVRFRHALIREALYEGIPALRRRVHRRVGEVLAALPNADPDAVAYHFRQAEDARAVEWLIAAGDRAQRAYALMDAANRYETAIALHERNSGDVNERGWLLYRLSRMLRFAAPLRGIAHSERAMRIADATDDHALAAQVLTQRGLLHIFCGDYRQGLLDIEAGIARMDALSTDDFAEWTRRMGARLERPLPLRDGLILNLSFAGRFGEAIAAGALYRTTGAHNNIGEGGALFGLAQASARFGLGMMRSGCSRRPARYIERPSTITCTRSVRFRTSAGCCSRTVQIGLRRASNGRGKRRRH